MYEVVRVSGISRRVVGLFSAPLNKLTTRNTRDANDFVHAKRLARKKRSVSRVKVRRVGAKIFVTPGIFLVVFQLVLNQYLQEVEIIR